VVALVVGEVAADAEDILDHDDAGEEGVSCCSHDASRLMREGTEIPVPRTELGSGVVVTVDLHCHDLEPADHGHTRRTWDSSEDAGNMRHLWRRHYHHFSGARSLKEEVEDDIHDND
jgi:hypothetical protein